jgi:hypothetical protein
MYRLVFDLVKVFYMVYVVIIYSVSNPSIFGFTLSHSFSFWENNRFFRFILRFDRFFGVS